MPRGKKPRPNPVASPISAIKQFAMRVEECTPELLDAFLERQRVLVERFHEKDENGDYKATAIEQASIHRSLATAESNLMRFAVIREQIAKERGVSHFMEREHTTNNLTLNFAPGMTPEQRAYTEKLYLASMSGKEVGAAPPLVLEARPEPAKTEVA